MSAKVVGLTRTAEYKHIIIKELEFILNKMTQSNSIDDKVYYFSGVQGLLNRVLNLAYTDDLLFAYSVTNAAHQMFQQRIMSLKQGETVVKVTEQQIARLIDITKDFLEAIIGDGDLDAVLKQYAILSYSTTGNGYYLMEKGILKI